MDLKGLPLEIAPHQIEFDTIYQMVLLKKNDKLRIYVDFRKLNVVIKKDYYPLSFIDGVINIVANHELYTFLDDFE
jgi:hypothetical protein